MSIGRLKKNVELYRTVARKEYCLPNHNLSMADDKFFKFITGLLKG